VYHRGGCPGHLRAVDGRGRRHLHVIVARPGSSARGRSMNRPRSPSHASNGDGIRLMTVPTSKRSCRYALTHHRPGMRPMLAWCLPSPGPKSIGQRRAMMKPSPGVSLPQVRGISYVCIYMAFF
jgi:hypothetical protein